VIHINGRRSGHPIDPLFLERWSPRAFSEKEVSHELLFTLFEAARWAPSAFNWQPTCFVYARRGTPSWGRFLGLLVPFNQSWAGRASALITIVSQMTHANAEPTRNYSHSFDAGAAWAHLALQAARLGLHAHAMTGFDLQRAAVELNLSSQHRAEAMVAVGYLGDKSELPENLRARESPSDRKPLGSIVFEGGFPGSGGQSDSGAVRASS
jgi:nitroreductase